MWGYLSGLVVVIGGFGCVRFVGSVSFYVGWGV